MGGRERGFRSLVRSLDGWDDAGPVSGLARDGSLPGSPVTFPERRSSGPGKVSRSSKSRSGAHTVAGQRRIHTCFPCIQHENEPPGSHGANPKTRPPS